MRACRPCSPAHCKRRLWPIGRTCDPRLQFTSILRRCRMTLHPPEEQVDLPPIADRTLLAYVDAVTVVRLCPLGGHERQELPLLVFSVPPRLQGHRHHPINRLAAFLDSALEDGVEVAAKNATEFLVPPVASGQHFAAESSSPGSTGPLGAVRRTPRLGQSALGRVPRPVPGEVPRALRLLVRERPTVELRELGVHSG